MDMKINSATNIDMIMFMVILHNIEIKLAYPTFKSFVIMCQVDTL